MSFLWSAAALAVVIYLLTLIPVVGYGLAVAVVVVLLAGWVAGRFRRELQRDPRRR